MFLQRLELSGFKSFAKKTSLEFSPPRGGRFSITGVVGPNGSGKSNIADAIRWVLGEQSMKLLRGKKSGDVIFSGSGATIRKSFAEVTLLLNNEDRTLEEFGTEISVTRRLYRSGESEYVLNGQTVRLSDIVLLLARMQMGQNSYSVIGQGMVDHVIVASPTERKQFFDEATGVREFQIKREQTVAKLARTYENLREAEMLLGEIAPRLRSLKRAVSRLAEKEHVDTQLCAIRKCYYGKQYHALKDELTALEERQRAQNKEEESAARVYGDFLSRMNALEKLEQVEPDLGEMQAEYEKLLLTRGDVSNRCARLESAVAAADARDRERSAQQRMISAVTVQSQVEALSNEHFALQRAFERGDASSIKRSLDRVAAAIRSLLKKLAPAAQEQAARTNLTGADQGLEEAREELLMLDMRIKEVRTALQKAAANTTKDRSAFFDLQRALREKQEALYRVQRGGHDLDLSRARAQTRLESLEQEIRTEAPLLLEIIRSMDARENEGINLDAARAQMLELRRTSEMIESIDPSVEAECKELNLRNVFLSEQVEDLRRSLADLHRVVSELDRRVAHQRETAFKQLNSQFEHFFKILFDGGRAALVPQQAVIRQEEEEAADEGEMSAPKDTWAGIEIEATPPGKKIQSIQTLSGGERAMTSIALICAIVTINPSPFVVLDEVDAALDESNSARFADILRELSSRVQFIVITHNRSSMQVAGALYGVTMGDDGISDLVSMKLEEVKAGAKE